MSAVWHRIWRDLPTRFAATGAALALGTALGSALPGCSRHPVRPAGGDVPVATSPAPRPPAWELPPPPIPADPIVPHERLQRSQLDNGLSLVVLEDHALPRLHVGWISHSGIGAEPTDRAGVSALLAEVMQRGAGERDALALAQSVENLGANLSVASSWDASRVDLTGLAEDGATLLAILADVVRRPRLEPREVERARAEQIATLERLLDSPPELANAALARLLYPQHRYGLPRGGTPKSVAALDATALRDWHRRLFNPRHATLFAVGHIEAAPFLAQAADLFGDDRGHPGRLATPPVPAHSPPTTRIVVVDRPDLNQARIAMGHEGLARTDPDRLAASIANGVLAGGGFLSRLMMQARGERGLTYGVHSFFDLRSVPGPFVLGTATEADGAASLLQIIQSSLRDLGGNEPPAESEVEAIRRFLAGRFALGLQTPGAIINALIHLDVHGLPRDSLDTYRSRLRAIRPAQVAEQARTRFHPERLAIAVVGPAQRIAPQLEAFGPVRVISPGDVLELPSD